VQEREMIVRDKCRNGKSRTGVSAGEGNAGWVR